ncbi:MAG: hypothetical protein K6A63_07235 [Acholeplasmatales bacterium]|nr:hypothetical protein [Acholeplasmatales bacterium]
MKVKIDGKTLEINEPTRVLQLIDNSDRRYVGCTVNNRLKDLKYILQCDSEIELVDLTMYDGSRIYQSTLRYVVAMAVKNIYPKAKVTFNYSVSRSIFASVSGLGHAFTSENLDAISKEVKRIIDADMEIEYLTMTKKEAMEYYESIGYIDKVKVLKYRKQAEVHMYKCGDYMNYMYSYMLPSTGYLHTYELKLYTPGFLILYPRSEAGGIPAFKDERVFREALREANVWANTANCDSIDRVNEIIENGDALEFINMCETRHNDQLTHLGDEIVSNVDNIKLICVAGPSSSGKTTFTNRLRIELKTRGYEPLMISMDDYYKVDLEKYPVDEDGNPDFEHIEGLDLELFDKTLFNLIQGEETLLPRFNFKNRERTFVGPVRLRKKQPILIEGIHGLNPKIAPSISDENKFKIYIAPIGQSRIDSHTPISISDMRLIRRMVRDHYTRGFDIERTIFLWNSVRNGEFKWIYQNQNNADFVFNSELSYELCVMKKHIVPLLEKIGPESSAYNTARRLIKFMKYFDDISDKWVPCNSILREFIGDSIFYTEDKI